MADDADTPKPEDTPAAEEQETPAVDAKKAAPAASETESPEAAPAPVEPPAAKEKPAAAAEKAVEEVKEGDGQPRTAEEVFLALEGDEDKPKILKAKGSKNVHSGVVHVLSSYNNTKVTITDLNGNVIGWSSSGKLGFKGSRKSTAYAAQLVSQDACRQAMGHGLKSVEVKVKGPGAGRESAVRAVQNIGIDITTIKDVTPVPHNGCRPKKPRRV